VAGLYTDLLAALDLTGVTVIGNSIGGWIAAEMALLNDPRVVAVVISDAAGLEVEGQPIADVFSLPLDEVTKRSYFNPDAFRIDLSSLSDAQRAAFAENRRTLAIYAGTSMADPTLRRRLSGISVPTLVVWGIADRMIPVAHAEAYAHAIPGARLEVISTAGHMPQLETPDELLRLIAEFRADALSTGAVR